jgi:hypothetical protein
MIVLCGRTPTLVISLCICELMFLPSRLPAAASGCSPPSILLTAVESDTGVQLGLRAEDLKIEVNHKASRILTLSLDTNPRRIVLMVDTSGSMASSSQDRGWGIAFPAARYAVDVIPANSSSALVTFGYKVEVESKNFEEKQALLAKVLELARVQPKGPTSLFDSIDHVLADFQDLRFGDAIYVVTDGGDNKSRISFPKLKDKLNSRGIRTFVFLVVEGKYFQSQEEMEGALKWKAWPRPPGAP